MVATGACFAHEGSFPASSLHSLPPAAIALLHSWDSGTSTVRVWASPHLSSEASDGWRVRILHVSCGVLLASIFRGLSPGPPACTKLCPPEMPPSRSGCLPCSPRAASVTVAFSCFHGRLDNTVLAGKFTRMRPSAAVVEDSVGSTSVSPSRNVLVRRFVARDLEFYHQLLQGNRPSRSSRARWKRG